MAGPCSKISALAERLVSVLAVASLEGTCVRDVDRE